MTKHTILWVAFMCSAWMGFTQTLTLKKGVIQDSVPVSQLATENFTLFLPADFTTASKWPLLMVFDMQGKSKQAMAMFQEAAEEHGFILAGSNAISDTLAISDNVQIVSRMLQSIVDMLPIDSRRIYTAGFDSGGTMASLTPLFLKSVKGVIACGAVLPVTELLSTKNRFYYIGMVGEGDYNYPEMLDMRSVLKDLKYSNALLVFDGGHEWPDPSWLDRAFRYMQLTDMARSVIPRDTSAIPRWFKRDLSQYHALRNRAVMLRAENFLNDLSQVYRTHMDLDTLKTLKKSLRKNKLYRSQKRRLASYTFQETLLKEDYSYYMEEDVLNYNYNNLGWWKFQMEKITRLINSPIKQESLMGKRLLGYVNALAADSLALATEGNDSEGVLLLWMLKTIIEPLNPEYYLNVVQETSRIEDFGTALFYLEELLKTGFKDTDRLIDMKHTGLLRIMPAYKELLSRYLSGSESPVKEK